MARVRNRQPSRHPLKQRHVTHSDFLEPLPWPGCWSEHSCLPLPSGKSFKSSEKVLSASQTCSSLTSFKQPLLTRPPRSAPSCPAQESESQ